MRGYAVNIKDIPGEKLEELYDAIEQSGDDVCREIGLSFPHESQPMVELGFSADELGWITAPRSYFHDRTMLAPDQFIGMARSQLNQLN